MFALHDFFAAGNSTGSERADHRHNPRSVGRWCRWREYAGSQSEHRLPGAYRKQDLGIYTASELIVGSYTIHVEVPGFKTIIATNLVVNAGMVCASILSWLWVSARKQSK